MAFIEVTVTNNSAQAAHRRKDDVTALLLYIALIVLFYSPVVFGGKSLIPSLYTPHGFVAEESWARSGRTPVNSFNVDIATPAYYEFPLNKLVGDVYKGGSIPLWNPYQAAGTPLAAQYSTKAFFPYQVLEDVSPVWTWDFFMLGRLLVAGFFTYLFLKTMGIGLVPAFGGGLFYMFSGTFVWFISLEQLSNTAMMLPVVMYCVERLAKCDPSRAGGHSMPGWWSLRRREVALAGVSFGLLLLAGQPEVALYGTLLAALYFLVRVIKLHGLRGLHLSVVRFVLAYAIGLGFAAPLLLIFVEFVGLSHHIHPAGSRIAFENLLNWKTIFAYLTPTVTEFPSDPEMISGTSLLVSLKGAWYRFLPLNGVWDTLGGYTGAVPVFVAVAGVMLALTMRGARRLAHRAELVFFVSFALVILLKNTGVRPFVWIGALPLFDRVWSLRWAGPAFILAVSVAGALGLHAIGAAVDTLGRERSGPGGGGGGGWRGPFQVMGKGVSPATAVLMSVALLIGLYVLISFIPVVSMTLQRDALFNPDMRPFVVPSVLYGSIVTVVVMAVLFGMLLFHLLGSSVSISFGIVALSALELWWALPRGYTPEWLGYKWVGFAVGLGAVLLFYLNKRRAAIGAAVALLVVSFAVDAMSPRGFPERQDPYAAPPYVEYLKGRPGFYRAVGSYGALFPNFASAAALPDLRYVNSLLPSTYHEYRTKYLHAMNYDEELASSLWFTGRPERLVPVTGAEIGDPALRSVLRSKPVEDDLLGRLTGYSFMGVKYFVMPKDAGAGLSRVLRAGDRSPLFKIVYDEEVRIYENPFALQRAFVVYEYEYAGSFEEAQRTAFNERFDLKSKAVLETHAVAEPPAPGAGAEGRRGKAEYKAVITGYGPNTVSIDVTTGSDGMLVLTDVYYPGWKARVNGVEERIYRVNGLVRGVRVKEGKSSVVFYYRPAGFRTGVIIFFATVLVCVFISWGGFSPRKPGDTRAERRQDV